MAGSLSNYAEGQILNWITGKSALTSNSLVVKLLSNSFPLVDTGTAADTVTLAAGFDSLGEALTSGSWAIAAATSPDTNQVATYNAAVEFTVSGLSSTGTTTVTGLGIYSGANLLAWTDISPSKQLGNGEKLIIPSGTLKLQLT